MEQPCGAHSEAIENLKRDTVDQWKALVELRTKLDEMMRKWIPVWVAAILTTMGTITGSALTVAIMVIKFSGK